MISAFLAGCVLTISVCTIVYRYHQTRKKSKLLKSPFETQFYIPKAVEHKVDYYPQDDNIHLENKLTLTANSEHDIMIRSRPRLDLSLSELQYGCIDYEKGVEYQKSMPEPLYYFNSWIKKGTRKEVHPDTDTSGDHYVDVTNAYHIKRHGEAWPKGEDILTGLRIKTKEKGTYQFRVVYVMPEGKGESFLTINVV